MPATVHERFLHLLSNPQGILLVTGLAGSGKTTTLYAGITHLRSGEVNIVTLEDPIEYEISGVTQSHAGPEARMTFAQGLRTLLRQDPDVILVGEIRSTCRACRQPVEPTWTFCSYCGAGLAAKADLVAEE